MRHLISYLILSSFCFSAQSAEKITPKHQEFNVLFLQQVMKPKLTTVVRAFETMRNWEDLDMHLKMLPDKDQPALLASIKVVNTKPMKLPKIYQNTAGLKLSSGKTTVEMNFTKGLLSVGKKDFSYRGENMNRVLSWVQGQAKDSYLDLFVGAMLSTSMHTSKRKCQETVNKFEGSLEITTKECESETMDGALKKSMKKPVGAKEEEFWAKANKKSCADFVSSQFKTINHSCLKPEDIKTICDGAPKLHACVFKDEIAKAEKAAEAKKKKK